MLITRDLSEVVRAPGTSRSPDDTSLRMTRLVPDALVLVGYVAANAILAATRVEPAVKADLIAFADKVAHYEGSYLTIGRVTRVFGERERERENRKRDSNSVHTETGKIETSESPSNNLTQCGENNKRNCYVATARRSFLHNTASHSVASRRVSFR